MHTSDTPKLSLAIVEDLRAKGFSGQDIADEFGVTRQYVSWIKHTYGGRMTPRDHVRENFPWTVPTDMGNSSPYKRLRDHGEYMVTGGKGMSVDKLRRLKTFYKKLREEGLVVEFDPTIPPIEGVSNKGGFAYRARRPEDGDLLIRVNEYTRLTEAGEDIWVFPDQEPA